MAERFKLKLKLKLEHKLTRVIHSLQICRPTHPSASVRTPVPAIYRLSSSVKSKVFDISFPSNVLPAPPPTTPEGHFIRRLVSTKAALSVQYGLRTQEELSAEWSFRSPEEHTAGNKKEAAPPSPVVSEDHREPKRTTSPVSVNKKKQNARCVVSRGEDESETLIPISSTRSLCDHSSNEVDHSPKSTTTESEIGRNKKKIAVNTNIKQIRRHRRKASMDFKAPPVPETTVERVVSPLKEPVVSRALQGTAGNGKVRESVAVVKKSVDPYEDFKRSMLEMILQKQMFEAKDLEQLLLCFLSLNSKKYHEIIVEAFSDIWAILFCD